MIEWILIEGGNRMEYHNSMCGVRLAQRTARRSVTPDLQSGRVTVSEAAASDPYFAEVLPGAAIWQANYRGYTKTFGLDPMVKPRWFEKEILVETWRGWVDAQILAAEEAAKPKVEKRVVQTTPCPYKEALKAIETEAGIFWADDECGDYVPHLGDKPLWGWDPFTEYGFPQLPQKYGTEQVQNLQQWITAWKNHILG